MRKSVVIFALLSLLMGFAQCDSAPIPIKKEKTEKSAENVSNEKNQTVEAKTEVDLQNDSLNADSAFTQQVMAPDTVYTEPADIVEIVEWEETDVEPTTEPDSLALDDEEVTEVWIEEEDIDYDEGEFDEEYVAYPQGEVQLNLERILKTELVHVRTPQAMDERDSTLAIIEERMSLNPEEPSKKIVIEKWYSPVNYRGYKFNRKKLMLYGVDKPEPVDVYFYLGEYYFAFNMRLYHLDETTKNMTFETVKDTVLTQYLLNYEY